MLNKENERGRMNILFVGGTGFIGRPTVAYLLGKGHRISVWTRNIERAKDLLGEEIIFIPPDVTLEDLKLEIECADAVINMAGEPLIGVRWNKRNKREFVDSRVGLNKTISKLIGECKNPPSIFIAANAIGIYGNRGEHNLTESSSIGKDFLSQLCLEWELAALESRKSGTRVCVLRMGIVIGREGGMLQKMMNGFQLGVGSYLGSGKQALSWVHFHDVVKIIELCLKDKELNGIYNVTSPHPVTALEFSKTLAKITGVKLLIPFPRPFVRLLFGEGGDVMTSGQHVSPRNITRAGYVFVYKKLKEALLEQVKPDSVQVKHVVTMKRFLRSSEYQIQSTTLLNSNADNVFNYFASPRNLGPLTPSWLKFRILKGPETIGLRSKIVHRIWIGPLPVKWHALITVWKPYECFVDTQQHGPFKLWEHVHTIRSLGVGRSVMNDTVRYRLPGGILGNFINRFIVSKLLIRIFFYRHQIIKLRFG